MNKKLAHLVSRVQEALHTCWTHTCNSEFIITKNMPNIAVYSNYSAGKYYRSCKRVIFQSFCAYREYFYNSPFSRNFYRDVYCMHKHVIRILSAATLKLPSFIRWRNVSTYEYQIFHLSFMLDAYIESPLLCKRHVPIIVLPNAWVTCFQITANASVHPARCYCHPYIGFPQPMLKHTNMEDKNQNYIQMIILYQMSSVCCLFVQPR